VLTAITAIVAAGWVFGLPNGSFIHDYWILPVLLPVWLGTAALTAWALTLGALARLPSPRRGAVGLAATVVVLAVGAGTALVTDVPSRYLLGPQAAGDLARATVPPPGQAAAWRTAGLPAPRWLSFYWDLPPALVSRESAPDVPDDDLVFVRLDGTPRWLGNAAAVRAAAEATEGDYWVLTGRTLRELAGLPAG
jgi:hypothetical protein